VAASRASALGIIDLCPDRSCDLKAVWGRVRKGLKGRLGCRISLRQVDSIKEFESDEPKCEVICVRVGDGNQASLHAAVRVILDSGRVAIADITSCEAIGQAEAAGVSGFIISGHEAGGFCAAESSFVLLQRILGETNRPVWVRGGIGPNVAAGCIAAGAFGIVLDGALLLARESSLSARWRDRIARWDGSETTVLGPAAGTTVRIYGVPNSSSLSRLKKKAALGACDWEATVQAAVGWEDDQCAPVGQDSALAARLAHKFVTVAGVVQAVERAISEGIARAQASRPLAEGSPLALDHKTRYPILQGPMTRVSDVAAFALAVAREGGLPFLALALLREADVRSLLRATDAALSGHPWGVGILAFAPPELRAEQLRAVHEVRPPLALIAGGLPDQAAGLERLGIATYLHAPSPGLIEQYLRDGARRFVVEGRECGGHVGPRSSFVLWEQAVVAIGDAVDRGISAEEISLVFAGGIHDARSAALVAALGAPLAARGVKIGVLAGTAYLFTQEAVAFGAIAPRFQAEALRCDETVLLDSGPGHRVRVSPTPFVERLQEERQRLFSEGRSTEEIREALERLNVGRLRVAEGIDRDRETASGLVPVSDEYQQNHGLYMLGQAAALRTKTTTIAALHHELCCESAKLVDQALPRGDDAQLAQQRADKPSDIAIVGMAAVFPGAGSAACFWSNTIMGRDAITEVPPDRWDWRLYYDPDPKAPDKIVSKWGGFLPDVVFDPLRYGMPPSSLPSIEPAQLIALEVVRRALADAGYAERPFPRERTSVVLGMGGGAAQLAMGFAFRSYLPMLDIVLPEAGKRAMASCQGLLPEWTEDSFPGFLLNVTAGRIANRLNLGGANYTVDAACGSSLAAASLAVRELESGVSDVVILGGIDTVQNPFTYLAFSKTQAFSPRGRCRPFDTSADGIVISEGVAAVVLKRLADAERDGDRIYAVIKGVGSSSDGRARGLTAPVVDGQLRALEQAYAKSGVTPDTVGYVEAHGTGTALGDVVEIEALGQLFHEAGARPRACTVGSVKSLIGHTKCAAGLAGLINASLALYHKVLPPTIGIETPNPKLDRQAGPFRLCTQAQPWLHADAASPRRAGVSAFGFGGTNFHAVLEAYEGNLAPQPAATVRDWPIELLVWQAETPSKLIEQIDRLAQALADGARPLLCDLAYTLCHALSGSPRATNGKARPTLVIRAGSVDELRKLLPAARATIAGDRAKAGEPHRISYAAQPQWASGQVAFLFPGQGAQSPDMLRELSVIFPEVRDAFEEFDRLLLAATGQPIGPLVFPAPAFSEAEREDLRSQLMATDVAQPAVGAACVGMLRLLVSLGIEPDYLAGHSYGELVALHAAGALSVQSLAELSAERGRLMREASSAAEGAMAALLTNPKEVEQLIAEVPGVEAANRNSPRQTVIAGSNAAVRAVLERAAARGIAGRLLPVACAFHTAQVASAREPFARLVSQRLQHSPSKPVYSNLDAKPHPADPSEIAARLGDHLASPVRFAEMIEAIYHAGARVFVEVGPNSILAPLVEDVIGGRPHLAVSSSGAGSSGLAGWLGSLAQLIVAGLPVRIDRLFAGRTNRLLNLHQLPAHEDNEPPGPSAWLVNGSRARPLGAPEPSRLGQASSLLAATPSRQPALSASSNGSTQSPRAAKTFAPGRESKSSRAHASSDHEPSPSGRTSSPTPPTSPHKPGSYNPMKTPVNHSVDRDRVIESFQQTMQAFLDVQKSTMLAYLAGSGAAPSAQAPPSRIEMIDDAAVDVRGQQGVDSRSVSRPADSESRVDGDCFATVWPAQNLNEPNHPIMHDHGNGARAPQNGRSPGSGSLAAPDRAAPPDRAMITNRLLETVRDRTGYPLETLDLDLDMEADLGIDSIKRVEILGKLREDFPGLRGLSDTAEAMDALARARTLGVIVDRMTALAQKPIANSEEQESNQGSPVADTYSSGDLPREPATTSRSLLEAVAAPLPRTQLGLIEGGRIVITDDGCGVAEGLAGQLAGAGVAVERIGRDSTPVDWTSPSSIQSVLDAARSRGPLAGLIHALPLGRLRAGEPTESGWSERTRAEVRGLFLLAKEAVRDLEIAARSGGSCLIAATGLGGRFASAGAVSADFSPGHGGVAGLVKTLAREWPLVRCRVVDFNAAAPAEAISLALCREVFVSDGYAEVGYEGDRRIRLHTVASPLGGEGAVLDLKPGEPIVISGGARGITALVAAELARIWRPTLLLLGTTPLPDADETPDTAALTAEIEIKAALHARLRRQGEQANPGQIEAAYQSLRRAREVRENLVRLRQTGSTIAYQEASVRDAQALARVLGDWRRRHGHPVGLIHGAGLIEDKLISQKTVESFDRVVETKLDGAINLIQLVRPESLKFTVLFSSIAGRFGNVGQSDYAAANDTLNKLAHWLDRRWPGRVLSLIWGPWSGVGMVSQLESHLGRRGLGMIAPEVGPSLLIEELRRGRKGEVEVIYSGKLGTLEEPIAHEIAAPALETVS
jgi:acyl transferase domain-containing protein/NAD(P)H-dependent flavin oxidoreductase YrpB (nitropropane dioxygenase family)